MCMHMHVHAQGIKFQPALDRAETAIAGFVRSMSLHLKCSPALHAEDPPPPALLCVSCAGPESAPGITDTAASQIINVHHARPPAVDSARNPDVFAGGFGCAHRHELTLRKRLAPHSDRGL